MLQKPFFSTVSRSIADRRIIVIGCITSLTFIELMLDISPVSRFTTRMLMLSLKCSQSIPKLKLHHFMNKLACRGSMPCRLD